MRTSIDLINLSSSVPLKGDVLERVWTKKDVSYDHFRVFGCRTFVHIPKDERAKLDVKAKPCVFLGYDHEKFGYVRFLKTNFDDGDKVEKSSSSAKIPIRIDLIVPPTVHANHGKSYKKVMTSLKMKMALQLMMLSQLNKLMENFHYHHMNHH